MGMHASMVRVEVRGEAVDLLGGRAAVWRRGLSRSGAGGAGVGEAGQEQRWQGGGGPGGGGDVLLVSDLHLGKGDALRSVGAALPTQAMVRDDLSRLLACIEAAGASRVLVLGDLLHATAGLSEMLVETVRAWVAATGVVLEVVPGNHDRSLGVVAALWKLHVHPLVLEEGVFTFTHQPCETAGAFNWAGHIHPATVIGNGGDRVRLPIFAVGERRALLPAFSRFTAGVPIGAGPGDRFFAVCEGRVLEVPARRWERG